MKHFDVYYQLIAVLIFILVAYSAGGILGMKTIQRQAIEKGHAEYVLKGDKAVWQWKEIK
mgnify:CR=1 FL=1